jgi:hypothetical protein
MFITFTRGQKKGTYATTALRDDGVLLQVPGSDRTFSLPHDLAHYVVEQELGLQRGFWGRVARGAIYPGMTVLSGRQPPHAAQRSRMVIREDEQQGVQAEVLVGVLLHIMHAAIENDEAAVRAMLDNEWRPRKPERGLPDRDEVQRACAALRQAERDWRGLEVGQSLTVTWQPAIAMKRRKSKGS